jgi:hypothetical protein
MKHKPRLDLITLANQNEVDVCGERNVFPYANPKEFSELAMRALVEIAASYDLTAEPSYFLWLFPNAAQKFKSQFEKSFYEDPAAAQKAYEHFRHVAADGILSDSTSRHKLKGSPSARNVHAIHKAIVFLTKVMDEEGQFYEKVIVRSNGKPIPVKFKLDADGHPTKTLVKIVVKGGKKEEVPLLRNEKPVPTFMAFFEKFQALITGLSIKEEGTWNGLPSRLWALWKMVEVRALQFDAYVRAAQRAEDAQARAEGSLESVQEQLLRTRLAEATLLKQINPLKTQVTQLRADLACKDQQMKQRESAFDETMAKKKSDNDILVDEVKRLRQEIISLQAQVKGFQGSPVKQEANRLSGNVQTLQKEMLVLQTRITVLEGELMREKESARLLFESFERKGDQHEKALDAKDKEIQFLTFENSRLVVLLRGFYDVIKAMFAWFSIQDNNYYSQVEDRDYRKNQTYGQALKCHIQEIDKVLSDAGQKPDAVVDDTSQHLNDSGSLNFSK